MSYILDALRRAEAQRSRGRLPGLHQSAAAGTLLSGPQASTRRRFLPLILLLLGAAGVLALGMMWLRQPSSGPGTTTRPEIADRAETGSAAASDAAEAVVAPTVAGIAPPGPLTLPRKAVLAEPSDATADPPRESPPRPESVAGMVRPSPAKPAPAVVTPARVDLPTASAPPAKPSVPPAAVPSPAAAPPAKVPPENPAQAVAPAPVPPTTALPRSSGGGAALPTRQELPPDIQRSLPPIVVSGTVYSSDPAQRLLVVNGELWHEGDQIRPDLVLEQIRRRDAVLRYRGLRFTVSP